MASLGSVQDALWQPELNLENSLSEEQLSIDSVNEPTEFECDLDQTILNLAKNVEEIKIHLKESQKHREKTMEIVSSMELPVSPSSLDKGLDELDISFALSIVMDCMRWKQFDLAKTEANRALNVAECQGNEINIARCYYWMGRIKLEQGNIPSAYKFFMAARPCAMDDKHPEGPTLGYYLHFSHPRLGEEYRRRVSSYRSHAMPKGTLTKLVPNHSGDNQSKKRKQDARIVELVLRPAKSTGHTQLGSVTAEGTRNHNSRPVVWEAKITEDALHANSPLVIIPKDEINADGMEWLTIANSGPRLPQSKFTFRCYPKGLASRTRPTGIFPEQPGENILSAKKWQALHQYYKNKEVTLAYLSLERWRNFELDKSQGGQGVSWQWQDIDF
ncbi:hypothetical protein N7486_000085 [Penicillium sp. IBT 16267x]|nr:hypothetical protein N7486_000085 [Penicillium sp. IBT 16267x]